MAIARRNVHIDHLDGSQLVQDNGLREIETGRVDGQLVLQSDLEAVSQEGDQDVGQIEFQEPTPLYSRRPAHTSIELDPNPSNLVLFLRLARANSFGGCNDFVRLRPRHEVVVIELHVERSTALGH